MWRQRREAPPSRQGPPAQSAGIITPVRPPSASTAALPLPPKLQVQSPTCEECSVDAEMHAQRDLAVLLEQLFYLFRARPCHGRSAAAAAPMLRCGCCRHCYAGSGSAGATSCTSGGAGAVRDKMWEWERQSSAAGHACAGSGGGGGQTVKHCTASHVFPLVSDTLPDRWKGCEQRLLRT